MIEAPYRSTSIRSNLHTAIIIISKKKISQKSANLVLVRYVRTVTIMLEATFKKNPTLKKSNNKKIQNTPVKTTSLLASTKQRITQLIITFVPYIN